MTQEAHRRPAVPVSTKRVALYMLWLAAPSSLLKWKPVSLFTSVQPITFTQASP